MSIGEVEIRGHMDGFDQGGQVVDRVRDTRPPQRELKDLAHDALAIILAGGRGSRAGRYRFFIFKAGLPQVAVKIDQSRTDNQSSGRQGIICFTDRVFSALADPADFVVFNQQIAHPAYLAGRVDQSAALD